MSVRLNCRVVLLLLVSVGVAIAPDSRLTAALQTADTGSLQPQAPARLSPGQTVERDVTAGVRHSYELTLTGDVLVAVTLRQIGSDTSARVSGPDSTEITQTGDRAAPFESRTASFITLAAGVYRISVSASRSAASGRYALSVDLPRPPTDAERTLESARLELAGAQASLRQGKYDAALPAANKALALRESVLGPDDPLVADVLHLLGELYDNKGDYAATERMNRRALTIRERALGPDDPQVARSLFNLGWVSLMRQDYAAAESMYRRALTIQEGVFGAEHAEVAATLNDFAILYNKQGQYERSIEMNGRVLAIRERLLGPTDPGVALSLNNLGLDYVNVGDYARAEPCFTRALQIYEQTRPPDHPDIAPIANNLAMAYEDRGDYASAERLRLRAIAIDEKARGPNHPNVAAYVNNLARLYELQGQYDKAGPLFERALAIRERALGPTHSDVGEALNNLADFYLKSGTGPDDAQIDSMLQRSVALIGNALGPDNHKVAAPLTTLAMLYERRGEFDRAEAQYQRALAIRERAIGATHPSTAMVLGRLARLYGASGNAPRAIEYWSRYIDVREQNLAHNLPIGSDRQKLEYVGLFNDDIDGIVSLHTQTAPDSQAALRLAVTVVLQRKGRALDAIVDSVDRLRARATPEERTVVTQLAESRTRLATITLRGPGRDADAYRAQVRELVDSVDVLEADLSARSAAYRSESRPITLEAVQAALPRDTTLIEFVRYRPLTLKATRALRYVAYLISADAAPGWVDLGEASEVDAKVAQWRAALRDPDRVADVRRFGRVLDERLMQPLRAHLTTSHVLVSPDGPLHLIPFAALVDERGRYLVERYSIAYLTSGRDLLRLQVVRPSVGPPAVIADPAFGDPATVGTPDRRTSLDDSQMFFGPLPGASGEVRALRTLLPRATFFTRSAATKDVLFALKGPQILHVATHGFFLGDVPPAPAGAEPRQFSGGQTRMAKNVAAADVANPLLRSGLALAGANRSSAGVMTALEAAGLDLWGTRLVVLSACDTGVGELTNYEGVYGLRRALVLAGSESQLMTLWPVSDLGARDLIVGYYSALVRGDGRADALRDIQLKMLRDRAHAHPYYWAGFILSGQSSPLESDR